MNRAPLIVSAAAISATLLSALGGVSTAGAATPPDPVTNSVPSYDLASACDHTLTSASAIDACQIAAVPAFDRERADEGLANIVVPDDFDTLSQPEQLLALVNVERVARGLAPAAGLSHGLDQQVADDCSGVSSAHTPSTMLAVFDWLYNDGPGWTNRNALLADVPGPVVMGASYTGGVLAAEVVGNDTTDLVTQSPTWADIASTITYTADPETSSVALDPGQTARIDVTVTSGESAQLTVGVISGAPAWRVAAPKTCQVTIGASCTFTLVFTATDPGSYPVALAIGDGEHGKTVAIAGQVLAPSLSMTLSRTRVHQGGVVTVRGVARDARSNVLLHGISVGLQRKLGPGYPWQTQAAANTGSRGQVSFGLQPLGTASYRLAVLSDSGAVESTSPSQKIKVVS